MPNTITPKLWTGGLFDAATEVAASEVNWDGDGWKLYSACPAGGVWCCDDSVADPAVPKKDPATGQTISFKPFTVYQITGCAEGTSRIPANMEMNNQIASSWLDTNVEGWVSAGLELGACESPGLIDLEDVSGAGGLNLHQAISRLIENRQRDGLFDKPTIHVPAGALPFFSDYGAMSKFIDIAVGPGYGIIAPTDAVVGGGWAYITGTVEYSLGSRTLPAIIEDDLGIRRRNYDDSLEEQLAAVRFDPCGGYRTQFTY